MFSFLFFYFIIFMIGFNIIFAVLTAIESALLGRSNIKQNRYNSFHTYQQQNDEMFQQQMFQQQMFQQQMVQQHNEWAMKESIKSVTPFEMGGYDTNTDFNNMF